MQLLALASLKPVRLSSQFDVDMASHEEPITFIRKTADGETRHPGHRGIGRRVILAGSAAAAASFMFNCRSGPFIFKKSLAHTPTGQSVKIVPTRRGKPDA